MLEIKIKKSINNNNNREVMKKLVSIYVLCINHWNDHNILLKYKST